MPNCQNCMKYEDCRESGTFHSGYCGGYNPARVTNKERLGIYSYEQSALVLADLFHAVSDYTNAGHYILEWLQSDDRDFISKGKEVKDTPKFSFKPSSPSHEEIGYNESRGVMEDMT